MLLVDLLEIFLYTNIIPCNVNHILKEIDDSNDVMKVENSIKNLIQNETGKLFVNGWKNLRKVMMLISVSSLISNLIKSKNIK